MRVVAILAAYNEERFIAGCLEHLIEQGVDVYLLDNSSTDQTVKIASRYLGRGLIGIEDFPRAGQYSWRPILERKEQLAASLDADWFMHVDADEIHLPPRSGVTLTQALGEAESQGYNVVNFLEFTFVPVEESPDHDHPNFQKTMRWYYPYLPFSLHLLRAWKGQEKLDGFKQSGGHQINFAGARIYPKSFPMRHYLFLSVAHAIEKYVQKRYDPLEVAAGWHVSRVKLRPENTEKVWLEFQA